MEGDEMRALREARGLDQAAFADWLNTQLNRRYNKQKISRWETGAERIPEAVNDLLAGDIQQPAPRPQLAPTILAVANQKGGVGKTVTAVNLAYHLAKAGARVLLIDADSQSNASIHLGLGAGVILSLEQAGKTTYDFLIKDAELPDVVYETTYKGLHLMPAGLSLADADAGLLTDSIAGKAVDRKMRGLRRSYDFVVIDCAPNLGAVTINMLSASDLVLVPVQTETFALHGVQRLVATITRIRRSANPDLDILGLVPTLYRKNLTEHRDTLSDMRNQWEKSLHIYEPIPNATILAQAASAGQVVFAVEGSAPGQEVFEAITADLMRIATKKAAAKGERVYGS